MIVTGDDVVDNRRPISPRPAGRNTGVAKPGNFVVSDVCVTNVLRQHTAAFLPDKAAVGDNVVTDCVPLTLCGESIHNVTPAQADPARADVSHQAPS